MLEECKVCGIKGSNKNVLNTSKSRKSVSYLCHRVLRSVCVIGILKGPRIRISNKMIDVGQAAL